jgi:HK97 family phage major capsid protein/HK97 family phage prohead protease
MEQAYALLDIKATSPGPGSRTFSGIASTPELDRQGDMVDPAGVTFRNPLPLLFHHDTKQPIGTVVLTATPEGILFEATLPIVDEPGRFKDRVDEAWHSIKAGVISGISIGHRILAGGVEHLKSGGRKITKSEICELSLVTIPANANASIRLVKSLAAPRRPENAAMTIADQIITGETRHAANLARMTALLDSDEALTVEQTKEYDRLQAENGDLDVRLPRLQALEKAQAAAATPVTPLSPVRTPTSRVIQVKSNLQPGTGFVRYCKAMAAARGNRFEAIEIAKEWVDTPEVELALRAAVNPATTTYTPYAGALVPGLQLFGAEFIELLRPSTLLGRIPGLQKVPFNVKVPRQTADGTVAWVSEGAPKPVSALAFDSVSLGEYKMAQILVFTQELARNSSPSAEETFRRSMLASMQKFMDQQFIDPAVALVAGNHPASITNGVTGIPATGNPLVDIAALLNTFIAANVPINGVVLLMSESNAFILSNRRSAQGTPDFPSVSVTGGSVAGVPVITSSLCGANIIAVVPQYILYADDGGVRIDVSQEASVQMVDNPAAPDATTVYRSFWQDNLIGLRAERFAAWIKAHANAVNMITGTAYVPNLAVAEGSAAGLGPVRGTRAS